MVTHIRGDTFVLNVEIPNAPIIDSIRSQIRNRKYELIADIDITSNGNPGSYTFTVEDTSDWPISVLIMDFEIITGTIKKSSDLIEIHVFKDVTR